jgi:hypothetical protein
VPGERIYRTGDMVRRRGDGTVEFIGRTDLQVKIQGFRVELGEIEDALLRCPEVADAAVTAQTAGSGGSRLIAYVVPAAGHDSAELGPRLRERLRGVLPAYMVPWAVVITSELRLNHHGKVDRQALPAVTRQPRNVRNDYIAPVGVLERRLAEIWGLILSVEPIGVHDDFFDLGGHSLLAAELLEAVSREFRTDVPARTLYLQPTIHELAMAFPAEHSDPATIRTTSIDED